MKRLILLTLIVILGFSNALAAEPAALPLKGGEKILFIGNSLSDRLARRLSEMHAANGLPAFEGHDLLIWRESFETHWTISPETHPDRFHEKLPSHAKGLAVKGSSTLWKKGLYNDRKFTDRGYILAAEAIRNGTPRGESWDYVILQGVAADKKENKMSSGADGEPVFEGPFLKYGALLIQEAQEAGAQPILYMNWFLNPEKGGGQNKPDSYYNKNFDRLIANYKLLGETFDVPIIPVGAAMRALSKERKPDPAIRDGWLIQDSVHGSAMGIALLHYAFASALTGKPATELRYEVVSKTKGWDKGRHYVVGEPDSRYNITITREIDDGIKRVAWDFVREYNPELVK